MNLFDFYYRQIVTQGEMDQAFQWCEDAARALAEDWEHVGVISALDVGEQAPAAMAVDVAGPGVAYGPGGERIAVPAPLTSINCAVDEYGVATAVGGALNEKWLSVFLKPTRRYENPAVDGNSVTVYTRQYEDYAIVVNQASEQVVGTNTKPAMRGDALLLADIQLLFGDTAIPNARIHTNRRQEWLNESTVSFGRVFYGTPRDAVGALFQICDTLMASGSAYTPGQTWFDSATLDGPTPPVSTAGEALDALLYDLAQSVNGAAPPTDRTGAALIGTHGYISPNNWVEFGNPVPVSVQGALERIVDQLDGHIDGGAPAHTTTAVTRAAYSWLSGLTAEAAFHEIVDDLALQTGTPGAARIGNLGYVGETIYDWFADATGYTIGANDLSSNINALATAMNRALPRNATAATPMINTGLTDGGQTTVVKGGVSACGGLPWGTVCARDFGDGGSAAGISPGVPWAAPNYEDIASRLWADVTPGWDWNTRGGGKPCFYAVSMDTVGFYKIQHTAYADDGIGTVTHYSPGNWAATYPTYKPLAIACNGQYLYILAINDTGSPTARMFKVDVYTVPGTPSITQNEYFDGIELQLARPTNHKIALGTRTVAFTISESAGPAGADDYIVIAHQADISSWAVGQGNVGVGAGYDYPDGAICHIGSDEFMFAVWDAAPAGGIICCAKATVVGSTVTAVTTPTIGPAAVKGIGVAHMYSAVFDGATAWFATTTGVIIHFQVRGSGAAEAERWGAAFELNTNNLIDGTAPAPLYLAFDGARVWCAYKSYGEDRIAMLSFDPAQLPDQRVPGALPLAANIFWLNPPATAGWASNGPTATSGPGPFAIIADNALVIGRDDATDGKLHRVCNLSRRGQRSLGI